MGGITRPAVFLEDHRWIRRVRGLQLSYGQLNNSKVVVTSMSEAMKSTQIVRGGNIMCDVRGTNLLLCQCINFEEVQQLSCICINLLIAAATCSSLPPSVRPSVGTSVRPSIRPSVRPSLCPPPSLPLFLNTLFFSTNICPSNRPLIVHDGATNHVRLPYHLFDSCSREPLQLGPATVS